MIYERTAMLIKLNWSYLHLFIHMYWFTESPVVEGKVKVDTGTSVVCLSHPVGKQVRVVFKQAKKNSLIFPFQL